MLRLRHITSVIAVYEEGSFTAAAARENATQSGISQHIQAIEERLGETLFERTNSGVVPTQACRQYYKTVVQAINLLNRAEMDIRSQNTDLQGTVEAGLMPIFTKSILAPVLERITKEHPHVDIKISESYSGVLTEMVKAEKIDFALVPAFVKGDGLWVEHFARDREVLVCSKEFSKSIGLSPMDPVQLSKLKPLNVIVPAKSNTRYDRLNEYFSTHSVAVERLMELDSMMGTLELVAKGEWVSILPQMLCINESDGSERSLHPVADPELFSDCVVVAPSRRPLSPQAEYVLNALRAELEVL